MKRIYFDESGNTGQNLIDEADPIFVLASCSFDEEQELEAFSHFQNFKGPELKFSRLRKTPAGQRAVLAFLNAASVTSATAAAFIIHKPYMVVAKYCDLVHEPAAWQAGVDFNARGANIATANLLTTVMPVFLNPRTWTSFLVLFVRVVRERTPKVFDEWRMLAELMRSHLEYTEPTLASSLAPVLLMRDANELFERLGDDELDPLIPAYFLMAGHWSKAVGEFYELVADASKVVAKQRTRLLALSDPNLRQISVGYDRRKMEFPLKVADIICVDSMAHRQIQFADILGGAIANAAKARSKAPLITGSFAHDVFQACVAKRLIIDAVWPSHEVDPAELGTDVEPSPDDVDAATYMSMILNGHPITKKATQAG